MKMRRLTKTVADKLAIPNADEWLDAKAVKMKFLVEGPWPIPGEYQGANYNACKTHEDFLVLGHVIYHEIGQKI